MLLGARQLLDAGVDPSENRRAAKAAQMEGSANSFKGGCKTYPLCRHNRSQARGRTDARDRRLRPMGIAKDEMSGHGFRAMARTILDEVLGFRPDFIEHQLAHAVHDLNGRAYNRTAHLAERRKMMQAWADYLDKLKNGADVIPIFKAG